MLGWVAAWSLWKLPRHALVALFAVEFLAVASVFALYRPADFSDFSVAGSAMLLSVGYSWATLKWEGTRLILVAGSRYRIGVDLLAIWCFFAAATVPIQLAAAVVVLAEISSLPSRRQLNPLHAYRFIYSLAGILLSTAAANACMRLPLAFPLRLGIAGIAYLWVGAAALGLAMAVTSNWAALRLVLRASSHYIEVLTVVIAMAEVVVYRAHGAILLWMSVPAALLLQRPAARVELKAEVVAAEQPMVAEAWQVVAREVVAASVAAAVLRIDTGDPAAVTLVARIQAGCDAIGQNGPNGLAILLTDCPGPNADAIAARIRSALQANRVEAHVAVAAKPRDGQSLADLLAVSEAELIAMEAATRSARSLRPEA